MRNRRRKRSKVGRRFVKYFNPVLQALKELGGKGDPSAVEEIVARLANVSDSERKERVDSGALRFSKNVHFARQFLVWAGYIQPKPRGVWKLTEKGVASPGLTAEESLRIAHALDEVFVSETDFRSFTDLLSRKKNAIIQGPPGVGKSFIANRLAYFLIGSEAADQVRMVQFHQSYSYEDFVQGWRPMGNGGFELRNGVFFDFCTRARSDPDDKYVFIIDEINRGNLGKIFGELFMLIEADKRSRKWAMPLTYSQPGAEAFFVPPNVYRLGLMNTADRSLAMVDYALRRRFTFLDLRPAFDKPEFRLHLASKGVEADLVTRIVTRMTALNKRIRGEKTRLGEGFEIGHSFFCPPETDENCDENWYRSVISTEVAPLIREYWFDDPDTAKELIGGLVQ